jgi:hypothetical protein
MGSTQLHFVFAPLNLHHLATPNQFIQHFNDESPLRGIPEIQPRTYLFVIEGLRGILIENTDNLAAKDLLIDGAGISPPGRF